MWLAEIAEYIPLFSKKSLIKVLPIFKGNHFFHKLYEVFRTVLPINNTSVVFGIKNQITNFQKSLNFHLVALAPHHTPLVQATFYEWDMLSISSLSKGFLTYQHSYYKINPLETILLFIQVTHSSDSEIHKAFNHQNFEYIHITLMNT